MKRDTKRSTTKPEIKRVAIVRLSALGDIINSAVMIQFIKKHYPNISIEWISDESFAPLLLQISDVDAVHTLRLKTLKKEKSFALLKESIYKLKSLGEFDCIIDMQGLIKSAIVSRLLGKKTHGFSKESTREPLGALLYKSHTQIPYKENVVLRNCRVVGDALGFRVTDAEILGKKPIFAYDEEFVFQKQRKNIVFVIGASWESKIYPKEHVAALINTLKEDAYIIWASQRERENAQWICENSEYATLAPKLTLKELVAFVSAADLVIGNDTGPTHLAWAQNIPSITLFGPTNSRMIYQTLYNIAIESPSKVDILKINKNDFSIKEIDPKYIAKKAKELLYGI